MEPATRGPSKRPLRLLSLDGGGIRGVSELIILQEIMHRVGRSENISTPLPADYFDMICGTSTGGLIALLLGRLRLSVPEAIEKYRLLAKEVFSEKKNVFQDGKFKASNLERAIKETLEWKLGKGHASDRMYMTDHESCKTFVCAVPAEHINKQPRLFRTWSARKRPGHNYFIWEAARATSAAPTFFKSVKLGDPGLQEEFIDAGIGCNNPTRFLIEEAGKEFGLETTVSCIVSIGTGKPRVAGLTAPGLFQRVLPLELIKVLANITTDCEAEASAMKVRFQNCAGLYHRLNVERGLEEISLGEWEMLGKVKTHTETYLNDSTVSREIDVIVEALLGRSSESLPLSQLDGTVTASTQTTNLFSYPPHQVLHHVAREGPLNTIHQQFRMPIQKATPTVVVLLGMGGCGKSQLALEYCRRGQNEKWFSAIFWLDSSSPTSIAQSFATIARDLSKPNFNPTDDKGNLRFVLDVIRAWQFPWLLIFDNFDDPSLFDGISMQQYFPQSDYGSILFTSRHATAKNLGHDIEVATMSDKEASQLLLKRSKAKVTDENRREAAKIIKRLGYHALAIDQAGAYILARDLDLSLYLEHYSQRKEKVISEVPELWDYRRKLKNDQDADTKLTVFTTWELSLDLIKGSPIARKDKVHLLTLAGFLDGKEVSEGLFECYGHGNVDWLVSCRENGAWDTFEAQDLLKELQDLSLIQNLHIGKHETTFSIHPLIQDWVKARVDLNTRQTFAIEAMLVLSAFIDSQSIDNMTLDAKQALSTHLDAVLQNDIEYTILEGNLEEIKLLDAAYSFASFSGIEGRYELSTRMIQHVVKGKTKALGKEDPGTISSLHFLAVCLENQGNYEEAKAIFYNIFQIHEKIFGKEDPETLLAMNNIAAMLSNRGKYEESEPLVRETILLREKVLGKEHRDTLQSMSNLASILSYRGEYGEAESLCRKILRLREKVLGKEHPDALTSMDRLASVLYRQGEYDKAESLCHKTLQMCEKVLGKEHPDTLQSMSNLASILSYRGEYGEAESLCRKTLRLREKVLGKEHPDTLCTMSNLASVSYNQGKYDKAELLWHKTLQLRERIHGKKHPDTLSSMHKLSLVQNKTR